MNTIHFYLECSLFDYIKHLESNKKSLEEQCALIYIKHVLDGIDTLHNVYRLHHGDIKSILPQNYKLL